MDRFSKFDMVIAAPLQLTIWYDSLDGDHRRTLNKYVRALMELINMNGWPELLEVLTNFWDNQRMVFQFDRGNYPDYGGDQRMHRHSRYWDRKKRQEVKKTFSSLTNLPWKILQTSSD